METFAAFTAQTDYTVGRILDALAQIGQLDNTLVFWEIGDNGASMEGTRNGVFNEMASLNGVPEETSYILQHLDEIGGPKSYNHIPVNLPYADYVCPLCPRKRTSQRLGRQGRIYEYTP